MRGYSWSQLKYLIDEIFRTMKEARNQPESCARKDIKDDVIRLVEAQIVGNVDLTPEEMVDAAFIMVYKINERCGHGNE